MKIQIDISILIITLFLAIMSGITTIMMSIYIKDDKEKKIVGAINLFIVTFCLYTFITQIFDL